MEAYYDLNIEDKNVQKWEWSHYLSYEIRDLVGFILSVMIILCKDFIFK